MAKFGEGDARWIVEDRSDGKNVGNWHWSEKDCLEWTRERLKQLLEGLTLLDDGAMTVQTTSVDSVEGEAFANTRKNKIMWVGEEFISASFHRAFRA